MITIHMTAASKVGCVRSQNEDMVLLGSHFVRNDAFSTRVDLTNSDRCITWSSIFTICPQVLAPNPSKISLRIG